MTMASPRRDPSSSGAGRPVVFVVLALVMFVAGAAAMYFWMNEGSGPSSVSIAPSPSPLEPSLLPASPTPEPSVAPSPVAPSAPPASPASSRAAARHGAPASPQVAQIEPDSAATRAGRPRLPGTIGGRRFVLGTTSVENLKPVARELEGFEPGGVGVKRAPQVDGQLELVMEPAPVSPGDPYAVRVYLSNGGTRPIRVDELRVAMVVDGVSSVRPLPPKVKEVRPSQRALLEELPGIWKDGVQSWEVEVSVTSKGQDIYRNRLVWK
jgi:hypothetical protein